MARTKVSSMWKFGAVVTRQQFIQILKSLAPSVHQLRNISTIIVHHTWRPTVEQFNKHPDPQYWFKLVDRFHRSKGWKKFGYHILIAPNGEIVLGRHVGEIGAHTEGRNLASIGVCLIGNFDVEQMPSEQWISLKMVLAGLCHLYKLPPDKITFHRDYANKTCPGKLLSKEKLINAISWTLKNDKNFKGETNA